MLILDRLGNKQGHRGKEEGRRALLLVLRLDNGCILYSALCGVSEKLLLFFYLLYNTEEGLLALEPLELVRILP